ncbi:MAG: hypothetical protein LBP79_05180 [Clostridiales bacterium]|jgi:hypothetical protein|nr:hypothetical protein [Clostridiales bacterium]
MKFIFSYARRAFRAEEENAEREFAARFFVLVNFSDFEVFKRDLDDAFINAALEVLTV